MNNSPEQAAIAAFFDSCAQRGLMADFTPEERSKIPRLLARWNIQPGMRILEPGCGLGRLTRILAEAVGPGGLVMALDMSEEMLRRAAQRAALPNTTVRKGSVYEIPSEDGFFDQVICFCAFPHFTRKREALREMARVLRPGGSLCISHLSGRERLNRFHQETQSVVSNHLLPAGEEMRGMVEAAGLRVEHLKDTDEEFCLHAVKEEKGGEGMTGYIAVETTTATREDAEKIARALVERRLAACAQVSGPIASTYWWQGAFETAQEWRCRLKTKESRYAEVESAIRSLHPYTVPQIVAWPITHGGRDYLDWIEAEVK